MNNFSLILFSCLICLTTACSTTTNRSSTDKSIVDWGSTEGITRLEESNYKTDFFKLANHFESQHNKLFCGPASAAIVLNSLRVRNSSTQIPEDTTVLNQTDLKYLANNEWSPFFARYTQNNVFVNSPKTREQVLGDIISDDDTANAIRDRGFQLHQLAKLFRQHGLNTQIRVVDNKLNIETSKNEIIKNLKTADDYVIVNYKRTVLQQPGGGHISPLGAYHQASDSFLILDVTPNKADWIWIKADLLFNAMNTFDTIENRGYLLISEAAQ